MNHADGGSPFKDDIERQLVVDPHNLCERLMPPTGLHLQLCHHGWQRLLNKSVHSLCNATLQGCVWSCRLMVDVEAIAMLLKCPDVLITPI